MKILYFEDNEEMAFLVCTLLKGFSHDLERYALGNAGINRFRQDPNIWEAVIMDLELPDVPGQSLMPEISALRPRLPIVVYSGVKGVKEDMTLYAMGATAVLSKPCGAQDFLDVLQAVIDSPPEPIR